MSVVEIRPDKENARRTRRVLGRSVAYHLKEHGDSLRGFALVTWDVRGDCVSSHLSSQGPVGRAMVPSFVKDALNRHIAVVIAQDRNSVNVDPGDHTA